MIPITINYPVNTNHWCGGRYTKYPCKNLTICICCYDSNHHAHQSQQTQRSCPRLLTMLPSSIIYHSFFLIDLIKIVQRHKMYFLGTDKQQLKPYWKITKTIEFLILLSFQSRSWILKHEVNRKPQQTHCVWEFARQNLKSEWCTRADGKPWMQPNWRLPKLAYVRNFFIWKRLDRTWWKPRFPSLLLLLLMMGWLAKLLWAGPGRGWLAAGSRYSQVSGPGIWPFPLPS